MSWMHTDEADAQDARLRRRWLTSSLPCDVIDKHLSIEGQEERDCEVLFDSPEALRREELRNHLHRKSRSCIAYLPASMLMHAILCDICACIT